MEKSRMDEFLKQNEEMLKTAQKRAGIDPDKVQKAVSSYLQIAKDNQLNYNELLQAVSRTKELTLQSLSKVSISTLPDIGPESENGPGGEKHRFSHTDPKGAPGTPGEPGLTIKADEETIYKVCLEGRRKAEARNGGAIV